MNEIEYPPGAGEEDRAEGHTLGLCLSGSEMPGVSVGEVS